MQQYVTYEQFGAHGDGAHDDMPAIVAAHAYANANGLAVRARDDATYYIGGAALTADIRTDTHFGQAQFIIDDRAVQDHRAPCFRVSSDAERFTPQLTSLRRGTSAVSFPHTGQVYVRVFDDTHRVYIRKGLNMDEGSDASDCFVVDAAGQVTGDINWDYDRITGAYAFSVDDAPIVIEGGVFTTLANAEVSKYNYYSRNFYISRSHVTVRGLTHHITGEGDHGAPYCGFLTVSESYDVTLCDCLMTPHKTYWTESKLPGQMVPMGSYDLSIRASIDVRLLRIRQTRDIRDRTYWGLMGSNFCKRVLLEDCVMSRFDAHCGVTDGVLRRCTLGHMGINLIGFGTFLIEDTEVYSRQFLNFREDYGSFFHGTLIIRRCTWHVVPRQGKASTVFIARNTGDHCFGYACGMPQRIELCGLEVDDTAMEQGLPLYIFPDYDPAYAPDKPYAYGTPQHVTAHVTVRTGRPIALCRDAAQYPALADMI